MRINIVGAFIRNFPFGTEIAFRKGFDRLGGHQVNVIDPSYPDQTWDYDADATVVFKWMEGYWEDLQRCTGKKIVYQPDDLRFPHIQQMMAEMRKFCDYALTFDESGAELAMKYGYRSAQRLLLTADDELYRHLPEVKKDIDFCFIGSLTGGVSHASRRKMVQLLTQNGFNVVALSDVYDIESIVNIYNRTKVILNHATDVGQPFGVGYGYQCRHFEAGFTRSCLLSNLVMNECVFDGVVCQFRDEVHLLDCAKWLMDKPERREELACGLYTRLNAEHRPEHRAQEMVRFIEGLS